MEEIDTSKFNVEKLTELRQWFHQNAELSYKEFKTVKKIKEFLIEELEIEESFIKSCGNTGLILDLQGTGSPLGETPIKIALRSDHDALPIKEENNLPYKSLTEAAHMCGHDGHTTCMLGGISLISQNLDKIPSNRSVRIIFQPAEEEYKGTIRGAMLMINDGCLDNVDEIYGMHNHPEHIKEDFKIAEKEMMALCNQVYITIKGVSGHGSAPEKCNNPIPVAASIYMKMFEACNKYQEEHTMVRFSFTSFNAGHTFNVIPEEVNISGSLRSFYLKNNDEMEKIISDIVKETSENNNCTFDIRFKKGAGAVVNTPRCSNLVKELAEEYYGKEKVTDRGLPIYGAEDFADYLRYIPGAFFFRIIKNLPEGVNIHHCKYNFDDSVIKDMSEFWYQLVIKRLNKED